MADPLLFPDNQAVALRRLEERVRVLETTNKLLASAITGGALRVMDAQGAEVVVGGRYTSAFSGVTDGFRVQAPSLINEFDPSIGSVTTLEVNNTDGVNFPLLYSSFRAEWLNGITAPMAKHTVPSDWWTYYGTAIPVVQSRGLHLGFVYIAGSASTTWEVRCRAVTLPDEDTSNVYTISDALGHSLRLWWNPSVLHPGVGPTSIRLELRRTAGTGTATVYQPDVMAWSHKHANGDSGGTWIQNATFTP